MKGTTIMKTKAPRRAHRFGTFATAIVMGAGLAGVLAPAALAQEGDDAANEAPSGEERRGRLTDEQRACLEEQGVQKPEPDANGERVEPTDEQKAAFRAAAEACGIELRRGRHQLTDEQRACLEEQGVQKPEPDANGERVEPTDEQKEAFRAAAEACGIEL